MSLLAQYYKCFYVQVKERSLENLLRNRDIFEPPCFMTCCEAAYQILEAGRRICQRFEDFAKNPDTFDEPSETAPETYLHPDCVAICLARVGTPTQAILVTTLGQLEASSPAVASGDESTIEKALGGPLHSMVIPGDLHPVEVEFLTSRLLSEKVDESGTSLPVLVPPGDATIPLMKRVESMFQKHQQFINLSFK